MRRIPSYVRKYFDEDIQDILNHFPGAKTDIEWYSGELGVYEVDVKFTLGNTTADMAWTYTEDGDDVFMDMSVDDIIDTLKIKFKNAVNSSKTIQGKQRIVAAEDDAAFSDFDEFADDSEDAVVSDDGDIGDTLDGIADDIDDMQDTLDDFDEDDVDIEMENNISGHYIAECERCHGVFISAVVEADQPVESIHGTCPLCEKESDQYLKWVVHDVDTDTEDF